MVVEAEASDIADAVATTQRSMVEAGHAVLGGVLELRIDAKVVRFPERYTDNRGARMWQVVMELIGEPVPGVERVKGVQDVEGVLLR
jgi:hypothetical protein